MLRTLPLAAAGPDLLRPPLALERLTLAPGRGSVTEVAYVTGFQALSNFAKRFCERFGESPSDYLASRSRV